MWHRSVFEKRGAHDKATDRYQSALRVRLSLFGRKHVAVAESMNAVGVMNHHYLKVRSITWSRFPTASEPCLRGGDCA